ncbi:MAG: hypothetical protein ABI882_12490 [Acidobacteriota bacterium]
MMRLALFAVMTVMIGVVGFGQGRTAELFEDPEGKYKLTLAPGWQGLVTRDGLNRVEVKIVYRVNENGMMRPRRVTVEDKVTPVEFAKRDEEQTLRFQPGYAKGKTEPFLGGVDGAMVTYDFTVSGRPMLGRVYYIKVNPTTIYVMRFTGLRNILGPIRNQTDAMARSLKGE